MKNKFIKIAIILLSLIFILGQTSCQGDTTSGTSGYYQFTGARSVEANFVPNIPVSSEVDTYEPNEEIDVSIEVINKMTEDIPEGKVKVKLTGDAAVPNFFTGGESEYKSPKLLAIDRVTGRTSSEEIEIGPLKYVGDLTSKVSKKITAKYCYEVPISVKANLFYTDDPNELTGKNLPSGSNPASSVQVTKIEQGVVDVKDDGKGELKFQITVKNTGDGVIIGSLDDCFAYRENYREIVTMDVTGAYDIECDKEVKLARVDPKEKVVQCKVSGIDANNLNNDPSELTIDLSGFAYEEEMAPVVIWLEP